MKSIRYIIGLLLAYMVSCQQYEMAEPIEEPVELTLTLDLAGNSTRGLGDGDLLDVVSVYLVDANKEIVAKQEDIDIMGEATEVVVKFEKSDKLKRGMHTLMAVANHASLGDAFVSGGYGELMDNQVHAIGTTDNISPKEIVQPLSLMKEIELHAGNNELDGELVRTFARIRIEVKNNSGSMPLKINGLTFSDNFTQKQAYVFDDGTDRKFSFEKGRPISTSAYALEPFSTDENRSYKTIAAQTSAVVFDSYLLESKAAEGEKYTYTLDIDYDDIPYVTEQTYLNKTGIKNKYENSYFLIQNNRSKRFIRDNNDNSNPTLVQGGDSEDFLRANVAQGGNKDYLWELERLSEDAYRIKNVATNRYIGQPNGGNVRMMNSADHYYRCYNSNSNTADVNSTGVQMRYKDWDGRYCLNDWEARGSIIGGWDINDGGNPFKFHLVEKSIKYDDPIVLTTIDPITQQSSPVTTIRRNDFINVLITVSYNPVAGKFEFKVDDWVPGGGNVEFN